MKTVDPLTPMGIDAAPTPPRGKSKKLADGGGLYLLIKDNGRRYWRLKFRLFGEERVTDRHKRAGDDRPNGASFW